MLWLAFARKYAVVLAIAAVVALGAYLLSRALDRADKAGYRRATAEMAARIAQANEQTRSAEMAAQQRSNEVSARYEQTLQTLDGKYRAASDQLRNVRLCKPASAVPVPSPSRAAASAPEATGNDQLPSAPAIDPRVDRLILLARDADGCAARLSALQEWVRSLR